MSIRQNILMGAKNPVTEQHFIDVCKMANCHNFISSLPDGYDTSVGEYGGMLSGGQKQRIGRDYSCDLILIDLFYIF